MPSAASLNEDWQQYRCILWGGYAAGNVGDELTLAVALQDMTAHFGDSVAILSGVPGYTRRLFPGRPVIPYEPIARRDTSRIYHKLERKLRRIVGGKRASIYSVQHQLSSAAWAKQLRACEMLYLVGGGYFSDMFQLDWLLLPVSVARSGGARIATAPIGLGPFRSARWARAVSGIEEVTVTAHPGRELVPLPEGSSYLGFIFARGANPEDVEGALREAQARLSFEIA